MESIWFNFALEIGFLAFLGVLYYFYQKRKILNYEKNKIPMVMSFLLQAALTEKTESAQPQLDHMIEALDDFLNGKSSSAPLALLKKFSESSECPPDLSHAIKEGLKEIQ